MLGLEILTYFLASLWAALTYLLPSVQRDSWGHLSKLYVVRDLSYHSTTVSFALYFLVGVAQGKFSGLWLVLCVPVGILAILSLVVRIVRLRTTHSRTD